MLARDSTRPSKAPRYSHPTSSHSRYKHNYGEGLSYLADPNATFEKRFQIRLIYVIHSSGKPTASIIFSISDITDYENRGRSFR